MPDFDARGNTPIADRFTEGGHTLRGIVTASAAPAPTVDVTPPVVLFVTPLDGNIAAGEAAVFDVTEESDAGIFVAFVWTILESTGDTEVIHDGTNFTARYSFSIRETITGGFRYTVRRVGGWPSNPRIRVKALDQAGNEST